MFPSTRLIPLAALGGALVLGACGEPPQPLPKSPPYVTPSADPISLSPSLPLVTQPQPLPTLTNYPTQGTYPTYTLNPTTLGPETISPTPTPSHAARCSGPPTRAQILTLIKGKAGVPNKKLQVVDGPFCSGDWSLTMVEVSGESADQLDPLMVVATGKNSTLDLVAAGSEVCIDRVVHDAPAGIRVLACGS